MFLIIGAALLVVSVIIAIVVLCGIIGLAATAAEIIFAFAPWILGVLVIAKVIKKRKEDKKEIEQK